MDRTCNFCGNASFRQTKVQYVYEHDVYSLVVDDVPCEQCEYCNEVSFTTDSANMIKRAFVNKHFRMKAKKKK